jgi:hypothetical protein
VAAAALASDEASTDFVPPKTKTKPSPLARPPSAISNQASPNESRMFLSLLGSTIRIEMPSTEPNWRAIVTTALPVANRSRGKPRTAVVIRVHREDDEGP